MRIGSRVHNNSLISPLVFPSNVVAILIKQPKIPATFRVEESPAGYVIKEREPIKPAEYYLLLNDTMGGRKCTVEAFVEVWCFYYAIEIADNSPVTI